MFMSFLARDILAYFPIQCSFVFSAHCTKHTYLGYAPSYLTFISFLKLKLLSHFTVCALLYVHLLVRV